MIAIVVPTIRYIEPFKKEWNELIAKYDAQLIVVDDTLTNPWCKYNGKIYSIEEIMTKKYKHLIFNKSDCVRNLGFVLAKKIGANVILSLDDDVTPYGDTIGEHLEALGKRYCNTWFNPSMTDYMRGFPYDIRNESECWLSHGVWQGVPDLDAMTQLNGIKEQVYHKCPVPKNILMPVSAMNTMFKIEALPYLYQAPMFNDIQRFGDIWCGIEAKKDFDQLNKCMVTGYAQVNHNRLSNVQDNLIKEKRGMAMNEQYGQDEYFILFNELRKEWQDYLCTF